MSLERQQQQQQQPLGTAGDGRMPDSNVAECALGRK